MKRMFADVMIIFGVLITAWGMGTAHAGWSSEFGSPGMHGSVTSLAFDLSGNLYAGGGFDTAGGILANRIAKWNGETWSALGTGMDKAFADALAFDSSGNLYAGGWFTSAGNISVNYIAKWNGQTWSSLGTGINDIPTNSSAVYVKALASDSSGNLYAGGWFSTVDGISANYIARWNETASAWSALGTGTDYIVEALAADSAGNLYAGGRFTQAGGVSANYIAKWDESASAWSALGTGMSGVFKWPGVYALALDSSGNLYAGGNFTTAGDVPANHIAKWNASASAWSALGTGMNGNVKAFAFDSSGNLYAGGDFTTAGGVSANHIAKWDGSEWSALGQGTNGGVDALVFDSSDNLYVGGFFTWAGEVRSTNIAQWKKSKIYYVMHNAAGNNNGTSWTDAYKDLQYALAEAEGGDEIWVAKGTYKPNLDDNVRSMSFKLKNDVGIYGGFAGTETTRDERDWQSNVTILSGDIMKTGDNSDNSYHVVDGSDTDSTAVLDGFTITGGNADYDAYDYGYGRGGGVYVRNGNPSITNCFFSYNIALEGGCGIYNENSSPTITNCIFSNNSGSGNESIGGGMYNTENSNPEIKDCTFEENTAVAGGGIYNSESSPVLTNCTFSNNTASVGGGGGIYNYSGSSLTLTNCTFVSNNAAHSGGGLAITKDAAGAMTNCTLISNKADSDNNDYGNGGGIFASGTLSVKNTLMADNTKGNGTYEDCHTDPDKLSISSSGYNIVENGCAYEFVQTGDITGEQADISISALADNGGLTHTCALLPGSIAIDAGTDEGAPETDQRGCSRVGKTDIGAFEYTPSLPVLFVTPAFQEISPSGGTVSFEVYNMGADIMEWTVSEDTEWFSVDPASGTNAGTVNVTCKNNSGLGSRTGIMTINAQNSQGSPQTVKIIQKGLLGSRTLSGYVRDSGNNGISEVTLSFSNNGGSAITDSSGFYYHQIYASGWTGTVTPTKNGYSFSPPNRSYLVLASDYYEQNYDGICQEADISSGLSSPFSVKPGETIGNELTVTVNNYGTQDAGSFSIGIYISSDSTITLNDTLLISGRETFSSLDAGDSGTFSKYDLKIPDSITPGSYYIGVLADEYDAVSECEEDNNTDAIPVTVISSAIHVKYDATGANDGTSWADAYTSLQQALENAKTRDQIWVAKGTYKPGTDRAATFQLISGVKIYGGFKGTEKSIGKRDWKANETCLSGDIGKTGDYTDNTWHVVTGSGTDSTSVLDGFIITGGYAKGVLYPNGSGAGILSENGSPTLTNCVFSYNTASFGGGMYNKDGSPLISNCTFHNNSAKYDGSGMFNSGGSPTLTGCTFNNNFSSRDGGGMYSSSGSLTISNCTFGKNFANEYGGGISGASTDLTVTNCTFVKNIADYDQNNKGEGSGIYLRSNGVLNIRNTLITDNHKGTQIIIPDDCARLTGSGFVPGVINSLGHNIVEHGCFSDFSQPGDITGEQANLNISEELTDNGGPTETYALMPESIAINAGTDENAPETDQRGYPRISPADIGAFEYQPQPVFYVRSDATGTNDGSSWENSYTSLESAAANAPANSELWVAAGTYKPLGTSPDTATFHLKNNVRIYGGFAGTETSRNQRDWETHVTILSGDIGIPGDNSDNSFHVVTGSDTDRTALLDGFTITGGNASGKGGGMYNNNGSPTVRNCVFINNTASEAGGMCNEKSSPAITNCAFINNQTFEKNDGRCGGMMNTNGSSPVITNCMFRGNISYMGVGGGMFNAQSSPVISNCTFENNTAASGGGMFNTESSPKVTNCTFYGNISKSDGGGMVNFGSYPVLTNCTFFNNTADSDDSGGEGGGIFAGSNSYMIFKNTIIGDNYKGGSHLISNDCFTEYSAITSSGWNIVENGCASDFTNTGDITGEQVNLSIAPLADNGGFTQTCALVPGSIAIDAGTDESTPETDQRGYGRTGKTDIGAFEYNGIPPVSEMIPGDADSNGTVDLQDAVVVLQVMAGTDPGVISVNADLNGDKKIGLAEVVYILQKLSKIRQQD